MPHSISVFEDIKRGFNDRNLKQRFAEINLTGSDQKLLYDCLVNATEPAIESALTAFGELLGLRDMDRFELEAIILDHARPALTVYKDSFEIPENDSNWTEVLQTNKTNIDTVLRSVGRIEIENHPTSDWLGTGWLVKENIIMTNSHVLREFAEKKNGQFVWRVHADRVVQPNIDFKEQYTGVSSANSGTIEEFPVTFEKMLHGGSYFDQDKNDFGFLKIKFLDEADPRKPQPIPLDLEVSQEKSNDYINRNVAVIGYPSQSSMSNSFELTNKIFHKFNCKTVMPGKLIGFSGTDIQYDCSTLQGVSGGVVIDITTGKALGIHYGGKAFQANWAIPSKIFYETLGNLNL